MPYRKRFVEGIHAAPESQSTGWLLTPAHTARMNIKDIACSDSLFTKLN